MTSPHTHPRRRVLVLFGGRSSEHPVSCVTAVGVLNAMDSAHYEVVPVGITTAGTWRAVTQHPANWAVTDLTGQPVEPRSTDQADSADSAESAESADMPDTGALGASLPEVQEPDQPVVLRHGVNGVELINAVTHEVISSIDVVFPLLHGPFGEDGTVQGLFETLGLPYVGPGVLASAVGMDKHFMKIAFQAAGLKVGDWVTVTEGDWNARRAEILTQIRQLQFPVFVKPARGGSSLGITRVTEPDQLEAAVEDARRFDPKVVVEAGVSGREIECAVLDGRTGHPPRASYPGEIEVTSDSSDHQFYDFDAKYQDAGAAELSCPARIPEDAIATVRALAVRAFESIDAAGLSRVDFFYTPDGDFVINEINTMPGFTPISMYPAMWGRTGVSYHELIHELVELAVERGTGLH